jgi:DNA-binding HxlR family transcriptional regulator
MAVRGQVKVTGQNGYHCPVETTLSVIGGKWKPVILWQLHDGARRFLELQRLIPGVTRKMLAQHLRELEQQGVVARKIYGEIPPKVEYSLTPYGETLKPMLRAMCEWGRKHEGRSVKTGDGET